MWTALANEFAKMRHLKLAIILPLFYGGVVAMVIFYSLGSGISQAAHNGSDDAWKLLFASLETAVILIAPILLAVIASRQVEIEHSSGGWLFSSTSGATPGLLCRAKFIALGLPIAVTTIMWGVTVIIFGLTLDISTPIPVYRWAGYILSLLVIILSLLAFHILLSARIENQIICIGVGVIGVFVSYFASILPLWLRHLLPWGYFSLTKSADYISVTSLEYFDLPYLSVAILALVSSIIFLVITHYFDEQES